MSKIIKIPQTKSKRLYDEVDSILRSLRRKGISYTITSYSDDLATVKISVTGLNGTSSKNIIVKYDSMWGWQAYYDDNKHYMNMLSELSVIARKQIQKMLVILRKI